jgi:L-seryl-tRNA(Ser) seleniumtransferase
MIEATTRQAFFRRIPPVNEILGSAPVQALSRHHGQDLVSTVVADTLKEIRDSINGASTEEALRGLDLTADGVGQRATERLQQGLRPSLRHVINATGVVLHTNMGRSPLAQEAVEAMARSALRYSNLELDLATGERGSRSVHVESLLCRLTNAEAAIVVNNNAAAVLLMLSALCAGRDVVVSRGELVEIGGAFRVPDIIVQGGARLVEVGTTNKTHLDDYNAAVTKDTGALLKVHSSNFKIVGFTEEPDLDALAALARDRGVPFLVDWGSGVMVDLGLFDLDHELTMPELLALGADLVTFSGDKLLGGPQGGFIVGRKELVERCRRHPLARAFRIDKLTLAGIEATLKLYLEKDRAIERIPTLRMLSLKPNELRPMAEKLAAEIREKAPRADVRIEAGYSQAGGGSLPGVEIPSVLVVCAPAVPVHEVEAKLREHQPPVMVRVHAGRILIDPRTLWDDELPLVASALASAGVV